MIKWDFSAFHVMEIGQSVFIPCVECNEYKKEMRRVAKQAGIKVKILFTHRGGIEGLQCWRVA